MANKRNQKHKKGLGQHRKKMSKGSGHLRGYLYYKIMVFSWQPILFSSQYLSEGCFIGFWGTLNSNLTMKLRTGYLRDNLYLKIMVFSCRPILFESCDSYESGFMGFRGRWIRIWHRKMSMSSPWLPILWKNIIFHHKKAQKKPFRKTCCFYYVIFYDYVITFFRCQIRVQGCLFVLKMSTFGMTWVKIKKWLLRNWKIIT